MNELWTTVCIWNFLDHDVWMIVTITQLFVQMWAKTF